MNFNGFTFYSKALGLLVLASFFSLALNGCKFGENENVVWIYTSMYKDTIAEIEPRLKKDFPEIEFKFYQAGSEEVAGKVYAESLAGRIQADLLMSSDRFWYEDMAQQGKLLAYRPIGSEKVNSTFHSDGGFYSVLSYPLMVISYNSEAVSADDAPKTFKELADPKWKDKVSMGSPLASGTSFTTVAFLLHKYGWDYFQKMRDNNFIAEGGNSGVIRRLQSKERPVGIVLLENIMRLETADKRIQYIMPEDGVIIHANVFALVKKERSLQKDALVKKIADWMLTESAQKSFIASYMHGSMPGYPSPGPKIPPMEEIFKSGQPWNREFLKKTMEQREFIKEEFSRIVF